jgi:hypothetical protein
MLDANVFHFLCYMIKDLVFVYYSKQSNLTNNLRTSGMDPTSKNFLNLPDAFLGLEIK